MKKKVSKSAFKPFVHDDLDIKNELVELARKAIADDNLETRLSAVLIYGNIAEYLAENLLDNLNHFIKKVTYDNFAGILFLESASGNDYKTLGGLIREIEKFNFPDKDGIIACLKKIVESRNKIFHNFAKSDLETITELLNDDLPTIGDECENLIGKINTVYIGLQKILNISE